MFAIQWNLVNAATIALYVLMILFLPFNATTSTIMLFAIVALWSRLPGVGTPPPGEWLTLLDVVDMFSMMIAINIGPLQGAFFSAALNLGSRIVGSFPDWMPIFKDTIAQFVVCLIIPIVHNLTGRNIIISMIWYSILRLLMMFPLRILYAQYPLPVAAVQIIAGGVALTFVNAFYAGLFGNFFDNLLKEGVKFNWILFLFVTIVIFSTKFYFAIAKKKEHGR